MKNDFLFLFIGRFKVRSVPGMQISFSMYIKMWVKAQIPLTSC